MDRLNTGEKVAAVGGLVLFIDMFFDWYTAKLGPGGLNAWDAFDFIQIVLAAAAIAAVVHAVIRGTESGESPPIVLPIITALGGLATVLILFRIFSKPDFGIAGLDQAIDLGFGIFIGLIAAGAIGVGGWMAMQEEGASFGDFGGGGGAPPPPPGGQPPAQPYGTEQPAQDPYATPPPPPPPPPPDDPYATPPPPPPSQPPPA